MKNIDSLIFDLDNTLYSAETGLLKSVGGRISEYIKQRLGLSQEESDNMRLAYKMEYGITLSGLVKLHDVCPIDFDEFVYQIDYESLVSRDEKLVNILNSIDKRKIVYTNAGKRHAEIVTRLLGIYDCFEKIVAIEDLDFIAKPRSESFKKFISMTKIEPEKSIFYEDTEENLVAAEKFGFKTALVGKESDRYSLNYMNIYSIAPDFV